MILNLVPKSLELSYPTKRQEVSQKRSQQRVFTVPLSLHVRYTTQISKFINHKYEQQSPVNSICISLIHHHHHHLDKRGFHMLHELALESSRSSLPVSTLERRDWDISLHLSFFLSIYPKALTSFLFFSFLLMQFEFGLCNLYLYRCRCRSLTALGFLFAMMH